MAVPVTVRERVDFHRDVHRHLVKGLLHQRNVGEFCDVIIRLNGRNFYAHRAVLAASSPYFRSMFTSHMKEQTSLDVDMSESFITDSSESFKQVLDFMYSGEIEVTVDNVDDMLRISDFLLIEDIKDYCRQFYLQYGNLTLNNCLCVSALSEHHNLDDVAFVARNVVKSRFHDYLVSSDEMLEIPHGCMYKLLSDREIMQFTSSDQLVMSILRWVHHIRHHRICHLVGLLSTIDLQTLSSNSIELLLAEPTVTADLLLREKLQILQCTDLREEVYESYGELELGQVLFAAPPSPGYLVEIQESAKPVLIAVNCNPSFRYIKILCYNIQDEAWTNIPISQELLMRAIPPRLGISAITMHDSMLYMFLSYNLPYPSDLLKVHIMCVDLESGMHSLMTFKPCASPSSAAQGQCCQTTLTDDRSVPPVVVYCNGHVYVVGNTDGSGNLFVCDPVSQTYSSYQIPAVRFISLARAVVKNDRYIYIWCRHRFGHEEYCINKEVSFIRFDCQQRTFSLIDIPAPPGISYGDFADPHIMCLDSRGESLIVHTPGKLSLIYDETRNEWLTHHVRLPSYPEQRTPIDLPYHGYDCYASSDQQVYVLQNPAAYTTSMVSLEPSMHTPIPHTPPPVDCISLLTSGSLYPAVLEGLALFDRFDDTYTRLVHNRSSSSDCDTEGSRTPRSPSDTEDDYEYDGYVYDDDIYGYYDDYEY